MLLTLVKMLINKITTFLQQTKNDTDSMSSVEIYKTYDRLNMVCIFQIANYSI